MLFDKMSSMTIEEWKRHPIYKMLYNISPTIWISKNDMSEDEKKAHSEYEILGGYLKIISMKEAWINFWNELKEDKKQLFTSLENFDKEKFNEITGISI